MSGQNFARIIVDGFHFQKVDNSLPATMIFRGGPGVQGISIAQRTQVLTLNNCTEKFVRGFLML